MPLEALRFPVTPVGLHYLLIHYDVPIVDAAEWRLSVHGERELSLGLEELRARPALELTATMECAGNGRARLEPHVVSQPWLLEAVGTGRWKGTPLRSLLEEAGVGNGAVEVLFTGLDRGVEGGEEQQFQRSLPLEAALGDEVLLAYELNGAPLPPQHGFPLRLLVPGWYGMTNVKWLDRIEVLDRPFGGYQQAQGYRLRQNEDEDGEPLQRMLPRSLLVPPGIPEFLTRERTVQAGECLLEGRAWSGAGAGGARRGERRRRLDVGRSGARPAGRPLGVARLALPLGRAARRVRPLLTRARRGGQRAAARAGLEPRRLREQRGADGARHGHLSASVATAAKASTTAAITTRPL